MVSVMLIEKTKPQINVAMKNELQYKTLTENNTYEVCSFLFTFLISLIFPIKCFLRLIFEGILLSHKLKN
jgi:hypothetical protein